jgi:transcriptional regulator with XRE-family HTH domain
MFATKAITVERLIWTLGDVVRKVRLSRGWKQKDLARAAGLNVSVVNRLEKTPDKSERATIESVAKALKIPLSQLYVYVEQATLFSELTEGEQMRVLNYERQLIANGPSSREPEQELPPGHREIVIESPAPARKRRK